MNFVNVIFNAVFNTIFFSFFIRLLHFFYAKTLRNEAIEYKLTFMQVLISGIIIKSKTVHKNYPVVSHSKYTDNNVL
jgi:hypothetical protein